MKTRPPGGGHRPKTYGPHFGGFCAFAVPRGVIASTAPEACEIVDGERDRNHSLRRRTLWRRDISSTIAKAEANWPAVLD